MLYSPAFGGTLLCPTAGDSDWLRNCDPNRGEGVNRSSERGPSATPHSPNTPGGGPNVPGGSPIAGDPGTPGNPGGPGGCTANCGPGTPPGKGKGNPGNDKNVGKAGEDPNGKGKGPTGSRGKNH